MFLKNENISVELLPKRGGLVSSIKWQESEILYPPELDPQATSAWVHGGMPLLFPFAGRVFDEGRQGLYEVEGRKYPMPIHGFVYAKEWSVVDQSDEFVELSLRYSDKTLSLFPWLFQLHYRIELAEKGVKFRLHVEHLDGSKRKAVLVGEGAKLEQGSEDSYLASPMPVSPGIHPYFLLKGGFKLESVGADHQFDVQPDGSLGKTRPFSDQSLSSQHCENTILHHDDFSEALLQTENFRLRVFSKDCQYTVLWSSDLSKYVCIEPWSGVPDAVSFASIAGTEPGEHPLSAKLLAVGASESFEFQIEVE